MSQPLSGGVARHVGDLVATLDRDHWHVTVACPVESELWSTVPAWVARRPISAARRPAPADALTLVRLLPLVRRADVVHAHSSKAGFVARVAALLAGRRSRCVFTPHAWSFWAYEGAEGGFYRRLERMAAHWCAAIVTVAAFERDAGLEAGVGRAEQYHIVYNGVDVARFAAPPRPVPGRILMVARFAAAQKRHDVAVRALALVRKSHAEAHLQLVGDGPKRPEIERLAAEIGVSDAVAFLGDRDDVPSLLTEASCLLLASDYEGVSLTVLEAMAASVPVVATDVGGMGEVIVDGVTGSLAHVTPESVAAALERWLSDPEAAARAGAEGRARARTLYSLERMTADTVAVYESLHTGKDGA